MELTVDEAAGLRRHVEREWKDHIAPFWLKHAPDEKHGGFQGWVGNNLQVDERADKGIILNARILWTFSRAYRLYQETAFRRMAERAYAYMTEHFIDREHGGVFWTVSYQGEASDTKKRPYAQAFALYSLAEFYMATDERAALDEAFSIFRLLESRCRDRVNDGYLETFERDWRLASDQRLSEVDQDEKKSMNTHLHVLEAYATLLRASANAEVKERLRALVHIFLGRIINPRDYSLRMFFDETWVCKSENRSFGHDIEASWLLCEAAEVLADKALSARVTKVALKIAQSVYENGLDKDGSLFYEAGAVGDIIDDEKHWWAQAEAVVGFVNAYQAGGGPHFLESATRVWAFIDGYIADRTKGEWFWKTSREGTPAPEMPKLSQWKCPYHNGRMCFEVSWRLNEGEENS